MRTWKFWALLSVVALAVSASALASTSGGTATEAVTITWWHNANTEPGRGFWQTIADEYNAKHPDVTVEVTPLQNEQFLTKIPVALQSDDPPSLFQQWGGGQMAEQVKAGKVKNLTVSTRPWIKSIGGSAAGWQYNGKQYGIPYTLGIVGLWYNKALFAKAGIKSPPRTWSQFLTAIAKLKAAGITPIALGAKDRWPSAFWWDYLAVRYCSQQTMQRAQVTFKFNDPCWVKAGVALQQLIDAEPFQRGFLGTPAQQGAASSAGLVGNGKAAMELMGHWNPSVMNGLTPNKKGLGKNLGWFGFPAVPGGKGKATAALGGGDGFSCSWKAAPQCVDFLKYIVSVPVQRRWGKLGIGLPVTKGSESSVTDPNLKALLKFRSSASFVQTYLDIAYGNKVGQAVNDAVSAQFAGTKDAKQVVKAIQDAAKRN
jgi:raffinose/stachyose/melibiose transport system substrate-binding protein